MTAPSSLRSAFALSLDDWVDWAVTNGENRFRAQQIVDWLYAKRAKSWDEMTNLSLSLREKLISSFSIQRPPLVRIEGSADTTRKYLLRLVDHRLVETVKIPASVHFDGAQSDRVTLCVSSQVGCAYGCKFCASGLAGFTRNLEPEEIVGQAMAVEEESGESIRNVVFMGMGEPLANLTRVTKAIEILNAPWGLGIGARHMTLSTSGLAPQIEKLADIPIQIRLAVSLHGATDEVRDQIMPVNQMYPLARLFEALAIWRSKKAQKITFEYILIEGVNDSLEQAAILARRAKSLDAKVNLIPYNTVEGLLWKRPSERQQDAFLRVLTRAGASATLRREKGHDIAAACGQLRLREETAEGTIRPADVKIHRSE